MLPLWLIFLYTTIAAGALYLAKINLSFSCEDFSAIIYDACPA
jgi:hypothetical protein